MIAFWRDLFLFLRFWALERVYPTSPKIAKHLAEPVPGVISCVSDLRSSRIPGRRSIFDLIPHQQQLPVSQGAQPHPLIGADRIRRLIGIQPQVLFAENGRNARWRTAKDTSDTDPSRVWLSGPVQNSHIGRL